MGCQILSSFCILYIINSIYLQTIIEFWKWSNQKLKATKSSKSNVCPYHFTNLIHLLSFHYLLFLTHFPPEQYTEILAEKSWSKQQMWYFCMLCIYCLYIFSTEMSQNMYTIICTLLLWFHWLWCNPRNICNFTLISG